MYRLILLLVVASAWDRWAEKHWQLPNAKGEWIVDEDYESGGYYNPIMAENSFWMMLNNYGWKLNQDSFRDGKGVWEDNGMFYNVQLLPFYAMPSGMIQTLIPQGLNLKGTRFSSWLHTSTAVNALSMRTGLSSDNVRLSSGAYYSDGYALRCLTQ